MIDRYSRPEMKQLWTDPAKYASWAEVEAAHLQCLVDTGEAPKNVLVAFERATKEKGAEDFIRREVETGHDVIAFVAEFGDAMGDEGRFLHRGLTSSDVLDTSLSLRVRKSLEVMMQNVADVRHALAHQAFKHAATLCIGRTHGIHAEPMSFGHILAGHFAEFQRAHFDLLAAHKQMGFGKLSGAVGHYSQLTPQFESRVLTRLGLEPESAATQVVPRDRLVRVAAAVTNVANAVDRFSVNMRHWARTEIGEVLEPFSEKQKGSSAMPHKRNPILAENLCGLARTVRGYASMLTEDVALWHERDISHSSVERIALPDLFVTCDFMVARLASLVKNMQVRPEIMMANLERTGGLWCSQTVLTALVERGMNRTSAYEAVQKVALPIAEKVAMGGLSGDAFLAALLKERKMVELVGESNLKALFNPERFLNSLPVVFRRTFGIDAIEFAKRGVESLEVRVPALHHVYKITVELLPDVLDTEAKTIQNDMAHAGIALESLRQAHTFVARFAGRKTAAQLEKYAADVLYNPVMSRMSCEVVQ